VVADTIGVPLTATTPAPTTTTTAPPPTTTTLLLPPPPPPPPVGGAPLAAGPNTVYVLGDSVMLGAQATVPPALAGWNVTFDAKESRRIDQGTGIVQSQGGAMGRVLVVHLCTNWGGGDYFAAASALLDSLVDVERVVWVTCTPWIPAVGGADADISSLPASHPNVVVADWAAISGTPGYTYNDGLHLKPAGATALADLVAFAVGPAPA
jgi:lysophospholipase L1-like esterase